MKVESAFTAGPIGTEPQKISVRAERGRTFVGLRIQCIDSICLAWLVAFDDACE
jgi:hypothetical protein